jgi:hypothetical protein
MSHVTRTTVDLSDHPDLVVIYLGMRVLTLRGMRTLRLIGKQIERAAAANPDGLLRHETLWYSLVPPHGGMRQYWRDFDALQRWTRTLPHKQWWGSFLRDSRGTGFWHESYFLRGGIEAIYDDVAEPLGLLSFATTMPAKGECSPPGAAPASETRSSSLPSFLKHSSRIRYAREVPSR